MAFVIVGTEASVVAAKLALTPPIESVAVCVVPAALAVVSLTATALPACTLALEPEATPFTKIMGEPSPVTVAVRVPSNPASVAGADVAVVFKTCPETALNVNAVGVKSPVVAENCAPPVPIPTLAATEVVCAALDVKRTCRVSPVVAADCEPTTVPLRSKAGDPVPETLKNAGPVQLCSVTVFE